MKTFHDTTGREWTIELNVASVKRVRSLLGVDLLALHAGQPPLITCLGSDVCLLCDVLFALVKPQADAAQVSDEQFGQGLGGAALLDGQQALYAELADFFRALGRTDMTVAVQTQGETIRLATAAAEARIRKLDLAREVENEMAKADQQIRLQTPGSAFTESPAGSQ